MQLTVIHKCGTDVKELCKTDDQLVVMGVNRMTWLVHEATLRHLALKLSNQSGKYPIC
jgi:hypothetical protein